MRQEYWREKLNPAEKKVYDSMFNAFSQYKEKVLCGYFSPEIIQKIYSSVCDDHPELYYLPYNPRLQITMDKSGTNITLFINNLFSSAQIRNLNRQIDSVCRDLSVQLSSARSDDEKEKIICEYLMDNVTYDIDNMYNQNAATVICNHKGQCSGISKATKLLLNYFGIETIIVNGIGTDTNTGVASPHSWNIVKIDGVYYHLDVTFLIGANLDKRKPYRFLYYNLSDNNFIKNHSWDKSGTPECLKDSNITEASEEINKTDMVVSSLFELRCILKKSISDGKHNLCFESKIQLSTDKLMVAIKKCCRDVISTYDCAFNMAISLQGSVVTINW